MTEDTFRFTTTRSIDDWLDISDDLLSKYRARDTLMSERLAISLSEEAKLMRIMQKSCRLIRTTRHGRDRLLYHYEMPGPTLTHLMLLDPKWIQHLKSITEFLLA